MSSPDRQRAWDAALNAHGTAWIFEERGKRFGTRLRVLACLGLVVPAVTGALIGAFGTKFWGLGVVLTIGGLATVFQVAWSVWALVSRWDTTHAYAWESQVDNTRLANRFKELAEDPPAEPEFSVRMRVLKAENEAREAQDNRQEITLAEKCVGMRAGLRQFKRACAACKEVPVTMEPTDCPVCGRPKKKAK